MRILTFSTLFPNSIQPYHGLFIERRLDALTDSFPVDAKVVAPIPWFPIGSAKIGRYSRLVKVPGEENRNGKLVFHPRYPMIPGIGMYFSPWSIALAMRKTFERIRKSGFDFDIIDAHYMYPDGVAAVRLGKWLGTPVVLTARGSDVNVLPDYRLPRHQILWAVRESAATITVSAALRDRLVTLGSNSADITVLRNGVDLEIFKPLDRKEIRRRLGLKGKALLSVGHLVDGKGHDLVIKALCRMPGVQLLIAGEGPKKNVLKNLVRSLQLESRVRFLGAISQGELAQVYNAADLLVLASAREGMPNVILEALACGTMAVATNTGGIPEIISGPIAGSLLSERSVEAIVGAVTNAFNVISDREAVRNFAERFGWEQTTTGIYSLFKAVLDEQSRNLT